MDKQEKILDLYFNEHLKQKEITKQVGTSQQYVSKVIKVDKRYQDEKSSRKSIVVVFINKKEKTSERDFNLSKHNMHT